ncbi:MAG: L-2-amino-thiazoline-4-carboxylic acid hydrolase [Anaerolineales bacterium]|nr:L-2-amino-thiazoline-4-carboxylic acid hydrolase [Anaerolineales bacterium]
MSHAPCAYAPLLDELLASPVKTGQGGRWEADPNQIYTAMVRLEALLSCYLSREIKQTLGEQSKEIVRKGASGYGRFRGTEIRRRVEKLGLPLDIPRMWDWWDLPVTSSREEERVNDDLEPYYHGFDVLFCPFNDIYQQHYPPDLMALHCEAMHQAAFEGYNPSMEFWLPSLMPRGEGRCIFRMRIPPDEAEKIERRKTGAPDPVRGLDDTVTAYRLMARKVVIVYHFFTDALLSAVGKEKTEGILRRALANWGAFRGLDMRQEHQARGLPLNLESFITYYDDPAAEKSWVAENVHLSPNEYHAEITSSAYADLFYSMGTGPLAAIITEEALPAQAKAYNSQITMTIPQLIERGDPVTEYHYIMG